MVMAWNRSMVLYQQFLVIARYLCPLDTFRDDLLTLIGLLSILLINLAQFVLSLYQLKAFHYNQQHEGSWCQFLILIIPLKYTWLLIRFLNIIFPTYH